MKMLNEDGIRQTTFSVLNPDYINQNTPQDGALARASVLGYFDDGSRFGAYVWGVDGRDGLRGVRNVAEGETRQK